MTELQQKHIKDYANLLLKIYLLEHEVMSFRNDLSNLARRMSQEDINEANMLLREKVAENGRKMR